MLKLKFQYFGHLIQTVFGKDPGAGKDWWQKEKGATEDEMAGWYHWLDGVSLSELQELVMDREAWRSMIHGVSNSRTWLSDWTKLNWADVGNLISCSSVFSKISLNIWKLMVHVLLKPGLENFEHYFTSVWDECNCVVVWAFFGIAFLWDWNENWPFPVLWPLLSVPNL